MGNSTGLAYDIGKQTEYKNKIGWTLHDGTKQVGYKFSFLTKKLSD